MAIAIASWAADPCEIRLTFRGSARGPVMLRAPAIQGFQEAGTFASDAPIPIQPGKGLILIMDEGSAGQAPDRR
jgi:hypothetical protein